ncbi:MAG TPA: TonB family protein [Candidatus Sulfotelmatobacter sp.]
MAVYPMISLTTMIEASKKWEGHVVAGKFTLRQWLGGSDHSAVFLTERNGKEKAAIKLIAVPDHQPNHGDENRLSRWAATSRISHPNLIRLFEFGRCQVEEEPFLFVVMEYAEEDLGQIVPQRRLDPAEVAEMLPPIVEALSFLHEQGFVHGSIKPSNVFAVDNHVKISADNLHNIGETAELKNGGYSAPEAASALSPAADVWSVGALLITVLSQQEPGEQKLEAVPDPYRTIAQRCLKPNPEQRCNLNEILPRTRAQATEQQEDTNRKPKPQWVWLALLAGVIVLTLLVIRLKAHRQSTTSEVPVTTAQPATSQSSPIAPPASAPQGTRHGSVLHPVQPEVSRQAQNTIHGRVKVVVEVTANNSGDVTAAKLVSPGPSRYFAAKALTASRAWKFTPPQTDGQPSPSTWTLRFEFGRGSTQVIPKETNP